MEVSLSVCLPFCLSTPVEIVFTKKMNESQAFSVNSHSPMTLADTVQIGYALTSYNACNSAPMSCFSIALTYL